MMRIFHAVILVIVVTTSVRCFGMTPVDTINNWQLYRDAKLLFRSNEFESLKKTGRIRKSDQYRSLNVFMFYDFRSGPIDRKIQLICEGKILLTLTEHKECRSSFKIPKEAIDKVIKGKFNKKIRIQYFDPVYKKGVILGSIVFVDG